MLLPVFVLTILVAIPNALAGRALFEGIAAFTARRTHLGVAPISRNRFWNLNILAHPFDALFASSLSWSLFELGLGKVPAAQIISSAIAARRHRWELSSKEQDTTGDVL